MLRAPYGNEVCNLTPGDGPNGEVPGSGGKKCDEELVLGPHLGPQDE